ncbi:trans-resveratrol di-O-methyltransferase-like [Tasmannia lanceolata]|uniref:trans-resveratrol di-O-methyltransferase-like n=1 Tax=Tasmannia lanceolata TaxID=3420 RepID=UPI004063A879
MEVSEREEVHELLHAQAHVWSHIFSFISSMSLKCAVQLGIPDIVHNHGHPIAFSDLITALPIASNKTACLRRLMRLLVHSGFFTTENNGVEECYMLTPSSRLLLKDKKMDLTPFLLMILDPLLQKPWQFLSDWFQEDEPIVAPFEMAHGMKLWNYASQYPKLNNFFNKAMASDAQFLMNIVVRECGSIFQGLESLVDVGGGTGMASRVIADAFPNVKCTVFDLPHVVKSSPTCSNVDFIGGDMFESIPPANAILLKILHDWSDEECVKILHRCKEAIPCREDGGKVIIVDIVVSNNNNNNKGDQMLTETQLLFDMLMMVLVVGKERDEREWGKIFMDAGFPHYKIMPVLGVRSVIELYP